MHQDKSERNLEEELLNESDKQSRSTNTRTTLAEHDPN